MSICISFGTKQYQRALDRLHKSASPYLYTLTFRENSLSDLLKQHPKHFKNKRGYGWWLWKPYLIYSTLIAMEEGDVLLYLDSTIEVLKNPNDLFIDHNSDIVLFNNGQLHLNYCKAECYYGMGYTSPLDQLQANGAIQIYRKSERSLNFVYDYFYWCSKLDIINDCYNPSIQHNKFIEHRHDQAILTNLAVGHNIELHQSPCQWGMKENAYFNHHRTI